MAVTDTRQPRVTASATPPTLPASLKYKTNNSMEGTTPCLGDAQKEVLVSRFLPQHITSASSPSRDDEQPSGSTAKQSRSAIGGVRHQLTTATLLGVLYANCIGSGYGFEDAVGAAGPLITLLFCLVIPWIWCLPTGLAVAELSTSVRSNSGVLMWINVAFHPVVSFMCVLMTVFITFVGNASYPTLAANYVSNVVPIGGLGKAAVKIVCVGVCAVLNARGIQVVGNAAVVISALTLAPFLIFTAKQLLLSGSASIDVTALLHVPPRVDWPTFLAITSWSFANIENAGSIVEEVANPKRTISGVMVPLMVLTYPAYFFPVVAGVSSLGSTQDFSLWRSGYWAHVADVICGPMVKWLLFFGAITTTFGFTLTSLCCTSRGFEGMGTMEVFPARVNTWLSTLHPRFGTPLNAIALNACVTCALSIFMDFESIVASGQVFYCFRLLLIYGAVIRLRFDHASLPRPYMLPCGVAGCAAALTPPALFSLAVALFCCFHNDFVTALTLGSFTLFFLTSALYVTSCRPRGFRGQIVPVSKLSRAAESHGSSADDLTEVVYSTSGLLKPVLSEVNPPDGDDPEPRIRGRTTVQEA